MVTDSAARKRSSPRTERRVQLPSSTSKTSSSSLKQSQRSLLTSSTSSPGPSRAVRARLVDLQAAEKSSSEMKCEDTPGSGAEELERSKDWIHVTQRELHGIRELMEFLAGLEAANRHVPNEVQSPDELLANAKVINVYTGIIHTAGLVTSRSIYVF